MTSQIDPTHPAEGYAYTANVRANFMTAANEITALQDQIASLQAQIGQIFTDNGRLMRRSQQAANVQPPDPPNTTSAAYLLAADGVVFIPAQSTRGFIVVDGEMGNDTDGMRSYAQIVYGIGDPPSAGTLVTNTNGILAGTQAIRTGINGIAVSFTRTAFVAGLVATSPYWLSVAYRCDSGSTCMLSGLSIIAFEILDPLPNP